MRDSSKDCLKRQHFRFFMFGREEFIIPNTIYQISPPIFFFCNYACTCQLIMLDSTFNHTLMISSKIFLKSECLRNSSTASTFLLFSKGTSASINSLRFSSPPELRNPTEWKTFFGTIR